MALAWFDSYAANPNPRGRKLRLSLDSRLTAAGEN